MKREKARGGGLAVELRRPETRPSDTVWRIALGIAVVLALTGCVRSAFNLGDCCQWLVIAAVGAVFSTAMCGAGGVRRLVMQCGAVLLLAIYAVAAGRAIMTGWNVAVNRIFEGLELSLGRILPRYAVPEEGSAKLYATLFMVLPAAVLGTFAGLAAEGRILPLLLVDVLLLAGAVAGLTVPDAWLALLLLLTALAWGRRTMRRSSWPDRGGMVPWMMASIAVFTAASVLVSVVAGDGTHAAEARRRSVENGIYRLRYDGGGQVLPHGDFSELGSFEPDGETVVMTVEMNEPEAVYLRGFVGEKYVGNGWAELGAAQRAAGARDFAWLHGGGFYGQTQFARLAGLLGMDGGTCRVTVNNLSADSGQLYIPYELRDGQPDENQIGDEDIPASGLRGQREYTYSMVRHSVLDYESLYSELSRRWSAGDERVNDYLESENVYREYAVENYLDVPEEARQAIDRLLGGQTVPVDAGFRYVQQAVQACLSAAVAYNETPEAYTGGDFLTFLFEESHEGYSVHYATAATLLFRSFGIPARYVEGYYISPEAAQAALENGGVIEVTQADAHAWVEVYRNGVGFVPFEAVPENMQNGAQNEQSNNSAGGADENPDDNNEPPELWKIALFSLLAIILLLAAAVLILELRRRLAFRRRARLMQQGGREREVELRMAYAVRLLICTGVRYGGGSLLNLRGEIAERFGEDLAEEFSAALDVQRQARFSSLPVSDEQYAAVSCFCESAVRHVKETCGFGKKLSLRWKDNVI